MTLHIPAVLVLDTAQLTQLCGVCSAMEDRPSTTAQQREAGDHVPLLRRAASQPYIRLAAEVALRGWDQSLMLAQHGAVFDDARHQRLDDMLWELSVVSGD